jgi:hypothetical protein
MVATASASSSKSASPATPPLGNGIFGSDGCRGCNMRCGCAHNEVRSTIRRGDLFARGVGEASRDAGDPMAAMPANDARFRVDA